MRNHQERSHWTLNQKNLPLALQTPNSPSEQYQYKTAGGKWRDPSQAARLSLYPRSNVFHSDGAQCKVGGVSETGAAAGCKGDA